MGSMPKSVEAAGLSDIDNWVSVWIGYRHFAQVRSTTGEEHSDRKEMERMRIWIRNRVNSEDWFQHGVSRYSYTFWFRNTEDATAFKLAMGIYNNE